MYCGFDNKWFCAKYALEVKLKIQFLKQMGKSIATLGDSRNQWHLLKFDAMKLS